MLQSYPASPTVYITLSMDLLLALIFILMAFNMGSNHMLALCSCYLSILQQTHLTIMYKIILYYIPLQKSLIVREMSFISVESERIQ